MPESINISATVNGRRCERAVEPRTLLVHFLRDQLGLTGSHVGCETSLCGACTVLVDGAVSKACTLLAAQVDGRSVTTVEGLAQNGALHPVQEQLWRHHGVQCGYCTSGMVLAAVALLEREPSPTDAQIRAGLKGNLCRCTGYANIVDAVHAAAAALAER
ncbi:MAG: (2Fe-2S)-binding protein [Spirochaetaceae bacterium]|nr:(2Fe-2S)-binding protein [Spirochaetaceae bacterium]